LKFVILLKDIKEFDMRDTIIAMNAIQVFKTPNEIITRTYRVG